MVAVPDAPRRVVSLAPNLTEIIAFIGGEGLLAGVDDFSDQPPSARLLPRVGGADPSVEAIVALQPDLVIGRTNGSHPALAAALGDLGIPLYLVRTERVADVSRAMSQLGALLHLGNAERARSAFDASLEVQRRSRDSRPKVLFMVWPDPLFVAAHQTYADDLIELAGGDTALSSDVDGWPQLSIEPLMKSSPDIIIYPDRAVKAAHLQRLVAGDPRWRAITAVQRGMVIPVEDDIFSRQGPRLALAAAELNAIIDRWEKSR
jgi:ABC-type Fe3+-hydroxamate transport system substrate-binding protein